MYNELMNADTLTSFVGLVAGDLFNSTIYQTFYKEIF